MGRSPCCSEEGVKKGPWTTEEDDKLREFITLNGHQSWRELPRLAGLNRCGKSCRLRWTNYLRPDIKRGKFEDEEEEKIIKLHAEMGNKWSAIAAKLPGRTDNEIKNHWNTHLRKKLIKKGIDPVTHKPNPEFTLMAALTAGLKGGNGANMAALYPLQIQAELAQWARVQLAESIIQVLTAAAPGLRSPVAVTTTETVPQSNIGNLGATFHQLSQLQDVSCGTCPVGAVSGVAQGVMNGFPPQTTAAAFSLSPDSGLPVFTTQTVMANTICNSAPLTTVMSMQQQRRPGFSTTNSIDMKDPLNWGYTTSGVPAAANCGPLPIPQMDALGSIFSDVDIPAVDTPASGDVSMSAATPPDDAFSNYDIIHGMLFDDIPSWAPVDSIMEKHQN